MRDKVAALPATACPSPPCPTASAPGPWSLPWTQVSTLDTRDLIGEPSFPPAVTAHCLPVPEFQPGIVFHPLCGPSAAQLFSAILFRISLVLAAELLSELLLVVLHLGLLSDHPVRHVACGPGLLSEVALQPLHRSVTLLTCLADVVPHQAALLPAPLLGLARYPLRPRPSAAQVDRHLVRAPLTLLPGPSPPPCTGCTASQSPSIKLPAVETVPPYQVVPVPPLSQLHRVAQVPHHASRPAVRPLHLQPADQSLAQVVPGLLSVQQLHHPPQVPELAQPHRHLPPVLAVQHRSALPAHQVSGRVPEQPHTCQCLAACPRAAPAPRRPSAAPPPRRTRPGSPRPRSVAFRYANSYG